VPTGATTTCDVERGGAEAVQPASNATKTTQAGNECNE